MEKNNNNGKTALISRHPILWTAVIPVFIIQLSYC
jgi:hypothetical protein